MKGKTNSSNHLQLTLHICVLFGLAIAQPLYSVLSQNAEFFVAHNSSASTIFAVSITLSLILPATFSLLMILLSRNDSLYTGIILVVIALLFTLVVMPLIKKAPALPWQISTSLALLLGAMCAFLYIRYEGFRLWLTLFSPSIILFPVIFAFYSPISTLVFPNDIPNIEAPVTDKLPPIVLIIFDEFSTAALLDEHKKIDAIRFPNFSEFANQATWYKNATTVQLATTVAIPAILSGRLPYRMGKKRLPTARDHPENIFTWLNKIYPLNVSEKVTSLCPKSLCNKKQKLTKDHFLALAKDMTYVYLHIITPNGLTSALPTLSANWSDFGDAPEQKKTASTKALGEGGRFEKFVKNITEDNSNGLHVIHSILPHVPYKYLPNGMTYTQENGVPEGVTEEIWDDNAAIVDLGYYRYLLQIGFVDHLLGKLITRLKELGVFEKTLIIITADHGVSFQPGLQRRALTNKNYADLLPVPLLIKLPGQHVAQFDERYVSNIDIIPTIADVLGVEVPWQIDGFSLLSKNSREKILIPTPRSSGQTLVFDPESTLKAPSLKHKIEQFGTHTNFKSFLGQPKYSRLVDKKISEYTIAPNLKVSLKNYHEFDYVDLDSGFVPALLVGEIIISDQKKTAAPKNTHNLAVVINGKIGAIAKVSEYHDTKNYFSTIIPSSTFRQGKNSIDIFVIHPPSSGEYTFSKISKTQKKAVEYSLVRTKSGSTEFVDQEGKNSEMSASVKGYLDRIAIADNHAYFSGWAIDQKNLVPVDGVHIFMGESLVFSGPVAVKRVDVAKHFKEQRLVSSGFNFMLPKAMLRSIANKGFDAKDIRLIATTVDGRVGELAINPRALSNITEILDNNHLSD